MWIPHASWCVYEHCIGGALIYIGSGVPGRAFEAQGRNRLWQDAVLRGGGFDVSILEWFETEEAARECEAAAIRQYEPCCNITRPNIEKAMRIKARAALAREQSRRARK